MAKICQTDTDQNVPMQFLRRWVSEQNGIRPQDWDFYYLLRQMEEDALLTAKYSPITKETLVKPTEYGRQQYQRMRKQLEEVLNVR